MAEGPAEQTARAKALIAERKYDEAVRVCRRVLLTKPDLVEVRLLLGEALLASGRYEQVRVEMMALARKHPNVAALHRVLGEAYLRSGQQEKARDTLRRAVELDPHDQIARDLLGEASDEEIAPVSQTIERWFGDDEPKTVEQELPPHFEETTPVPRKLPHPDAPSSSVQVDPALAIEAARAMAPRVPSPGAPVAGPRVPSPGSPAAGARVPPPAAAPALGAVPPAGPPVPSPAPGATTVARAVRPRKATITGVPAMPLPAAIAPPGPAPRADFDADATTHRGAAARRARAADPVTDELEIVEEPALEPAPELVEEPAFEAAREPVDEDIEEDEDEPTMMGRRPASLRSSPPSAGTSAAGGPGAPASWAGAAEPPPPGWAGSAAASPSWAGAPEHAPPPRAAPPRSSPPPALAAPAFSGAAFPGAAHPSPAAAPRPAPRSGPPPVMQAAPPTAPMAASTATPITPPVLGPPGAARPRLGGGAGSSPDAIEATDPRRLEAPVPAQVKTDAVPRRRASPRALLIAAAIGVAVVVLGALGVRSFVRGQADDAIREAASAAGADGRRTSIQRALATLAENGADAPWRVALQARLLATLTLEHSEDHAAEVEAALASLAPEDAALPDARVARSLLLVAQGRGGDALGVLAGVAASGDELAEAFRARAWAAATSGRLPEAEESARQALAARPRTARHASLEAVLRFQAGDAAGAISVLDSVPNPSTSPALRIARARVLLESGGDPAAAGAEADAVIGELAPSATAIELGWAHLVRARLAAARGESGVARAEAQEAAQRAPRFDEAYGLAVAETLLSAGDTAGARAALGQLPETSIDPTRRAGLSAEVALAADDLAAAEQALVAAGSGAHADLLRGRVREARGELDEARQLFERAAADPREALSARTRAGAVLLRLNRPREARGQLEQALRLAPADPEAVSLFVRAALASGDAAAAEAALTAALAQRPDAIDLVAARGSVLLALGRIDEALAALEQACHARPEDAELRAELGEAALRAGRRDAASAAFAEALRLSPTLARAHLGTARLALEDARWDEVQAGIDRAASGGAPELEIARLRATLAAARGLGAGAVQSVEQLLRGHARDATLLAMLGHLYSQAEEDRDARDVYTRALRADDEEPEALLGRAGVEIRRGDLRGAARSIDRAERAGRQRGATASFMARLTVARARLQFEVSHFDDARRLAEEAIALDPKCGEAHLVLAILAEEGDGDPVPPLRSAIAGTFVPPEALGLLTPRASGAEACELGRRYLAAAPRGYDRGDVDRATRRCR